MKLFLSSLAMLVTLAAVCVAQEPPFPAPQEEHQWLKQFAGDWTSTMKTTALPDQPAMECSGSMKSRMLGGFWVVNESQGDMEGMTFNAIQTIGYNAEKKRYVGSWIDSMTDHLWHYEGTVDSSGKKLVLEAEGPNFMKGGALTKFRDSYEFKAPDLIIATSEMMGDDGEWITFMTGEMKRKANE